MSSSPPDEDSFSKDKKKPLLEKAATVVTQAEAKMEIEDADSLGKKQALSMASDGVSVTDLPILQSLVMVPQSSGLGASKLPASKTLLMKREGPKKKVRMDVPISPSTARTQTTILSETTKHFSDEDDDEAKDNVANYRTESVGSTMSDSGASIRYIDVNRHNHAKQRKCLFLQADGQKFKGNEIVTSRYNVVTFLPLNLLLQFSKMANFYFLVLTIMECFEPISDSGGIPILAIPLSFVVGISMIKDIYEDYQRHASDNEENNRKCHAAPLSTNGEASGGTRQAKWKDLEVGQIIKISEAEYFPCDMLVLSSSLPKGLCYVETKNLDGETNLKHKQVHKDILKLASTEEEILTNFNNAIIECEKENESIYTFQGNLKFADRELAVPIDVDQILLRGSSLRNTEWVYGVAVYTGHDSKVMMNSLSSQTKFSKIEKATNVYILISVVIQFVVCFFSGAYTALWQNLDGVRESLYYLDLNPDKEAAEFDEFNHSLGVQVVVNFGKWFLIMMNFVSISLLVSLEMVKFAQGIFIEKDWMIYDEEKDLSAKVNSSNLNEELGMVHYVFSDKTGTLTKNIMDFKKFSAGPKSYGEDQEEMYPDKYEKGVTNVSFTSPDFEEDWTKPMEAGQKSPNPYLERFINVLAVCHTIIVETKNDVTHYNASSPDELALTNAARHFGITFQERDEDGNIIIHNRFTGKTEKYELLNIIEFNSARKRMSVIVKRPDGKIVIMTKGADSIVIPRLHKGQEDLIETTQEYLTKYANTGLRTLILAEKEVEADFYYKWEKKYTQALCAMTNRQDKIDECAEQIEWDFTMVGSTAIEDKLQDEVADVIEHIKQAGIKLWVLTGDKIETAINIGFSCKLIDEEMEIFIIDESSTRDIYNQIKDFQDKMLMINKSRDVAVVVGGEQLGKILKSEKNKKLQKAFVKLADKANSVICCRVSPKQKAQIVKLVIEFRQGVTTLAIGDGANDVNMITSAHVGVGISGLEGQQAARSADYAIGQFRFLRNLLFVHGREAYRRNTYLILYMFYKNVIYVLPIWWFGFLSFFSGTQIYNTLLYNSYNIFFTGMPICWYCTFDWEHTKEKLLAIPALYDIGLQDKCFNPFVFWFWYFSAVWQGAILLFLTFYTLDESQSEKLRYNQYDKPESKTLSGSLDLNGVFIFQAIVVAVNIKIFIQSNTFSFFSIFWQFGSIAMFYVFFYLFNIHPDLDLFDLMPTLFSFESQYFLLLFFMTSYSLIEYGLSIFEKHISNTIEEGKQQEKQEEAEFLRVQRMSRKRKLTKYEHHGFAFDGADGQDRLVAEKIMSRIQSAIKSQIFDNANLFSQPSGSINEGGGMSLKSLIAGSTSKVSGGSDEAGSGVADSLGKKLTLGSLMGGGGNSDEGNSGNNSKGLINIMKANFAKFGTLDQAKFSSVKYDKMASDYEKQSEKSESFKKEREVQQPPQIVPSLSPVAEKDQETTAAMFSLNPDSPTNSQREE